MTGFPKAHQDGFVFSKIRGLVRPDRRQVFRAERDDSAVPVNVQAAAAKPLDIEIHGVLERHGGQGK